MSNHRSVYWAYKTCYSMTWTWHDHDPKPGKMRTWGREDMLGKMCCSMMFDAVVEQPFPESSFQRCFTLSVLCSLRFLYHVSVLSLVISFGLLSRCFTLSVLCILQIIPLCDVAQCTLYMCANCVYPCNKHLYICAIYKATCGLLAHYYLHGVCTLYCPD